jgi:hypothetical protein
MVAWWLSQTTQTLLSSANVRPLADETITSSFPRVSATWEVAAPVYLRRVVPTLTPQGAGDKSLATAAPFPQ